MAVELSDELSWILHASGEEAHRAGADSVQTQHLLLGLIRDRASLAVQILERFGISVNAVRHEVEQIIGRPEPRLTNSFGIPWTPRADTVFLYAEIEVETLRDESLRSEHLLIGLLRGPDGVAKTVLNHCGLRANSVRTAVNEEREKNRRWLAWLGWQAGTPAAILLAAIGDQNWEALPILADALEEAGCTEGDVLDHLRNPTTHPCWPERHPGCWVLRRLLDAEKIRQKATVAAQSKRWWQFWK